MRREWSEMGFTPAQIDAALGEQEPKRNDPRVFEIEPENSDTVALFARLQTQWIKETVVAGKLLFTRHHGLKYEGIPGLATAVGIALTEAVWDGLRLMEAEALRIYQRREEAALSRL